MNQAVVHKPVLVDVADLKPHPRNYKQHPKEQLEHIVKSIDEHGFYRNVVVARDNTILAGHGVVQAVQSMGMFGPSQVPVIKLDLDPADPRALKVLVTDNEVGKLAESNDREMTGMLKDIMSASDLLGTGFDAQSLAAAVMVSRPIEEIRDKNEAAHWVGMPEFDPGKQFFELRLMFATEQERDEFVKKVGVNPHDRSRDGRMRSAWYPPRQLMDRVNVLFTEDGQPSEALL